MSAQRTARRTLRALIGPGLMMLVLFSTSACGGGSAQEGAKARPLPLYENGLRPGEYHSVKFKPSLSFRVGKGLSNDEEQLADYIELGQGEKRWIRFTNIEEVYESGTTNAVKVPRDMIGWFQDHPYLKTSKPKPVTVGGARGEQFDVLVDNLPKDYSEGYCGSGCVDIAPLSGGEQLLLFKEGRERRVIVLEPMKGETVAIDFGSTQIPDFHDFVPEAKKVVNSVKWGGS